MVHAAGLKGKGVKLLHHFPDQLWSLGDKSVPDPSFTTSRIFPQVRMRQCAACACVGTLPTQPLLSND